jgi:CheY-like chemotaxis protein
LIDAEAAAFMAGAGERVQVDGPPLMLNPQAYSALALVMHELVTNSAKYGSLSNSGLVHIAWQREAGGDLLLRWRESGGPPVKPPTRKGFGSTIIDRSIPYDLGGEARIDYKPAGVEAEFRIPAKHVSEPKDHSGPAIRFARSEPDMHYTAEPIIEGRTVLLVEDSLIIALDAEDVLKRLGADYVATAATVEQGLRAIEDTPPALAILDVNLGDHTSFAVADRLRELRIPYLFATGYGEQAQLPDDHAERTVLQKPYTLENMARALPELIREDA